MEQITITKEALTKLLRASEKMVQYLIHDEAKDYANVKEFNGKEPEDHIYNHVLEAKLLIRDIDKINVDKYINERLEYYDSKCSESEIWLDRLTGDYYEIDVEHVRDFSNLPDRKVK
tara:strand:- start:310 stop:660 length:351 start_codon:yes stop_codon:yes gene_type:complete